MLGKNFSPTNCLPSYCWIIYRHKWLHWYLYLRLGCYRTELTHDIFIGLICKSEYTLASEYDSNYEYKLKGKGSK